MRERTDRWSVPHRGLAGSDQVGAIRSARLLRTLLTSVDTACIVSRSSGHPTSRVASASRSWLAGVQPGRPLFRRQDDGHPIVDRSHRCVRCGRDDRGAVQEASLGVVGVLPRRPEPGDGQRLVVDSMDEHRLLEQFALGVHRTTLDAGLPFVEAVHRDDAPLRAEQPLERRLLGQGLGAGVDHPGTDLAILRPARHQTPVEGIEPRRPVTGTHQRVDVLGRGDVVVLAERFGDHLGRQDRVEVRRDPIRAPR